VLLIGIGVWKPPPQSPSSFKAGPFNLKGFPSLSRYSCQILSDILSRAKLLILLVAILS
jgi:hypothetical protein